MSCLKHSWEFSKYFTYTIISAGNVFKAKNIIDAVAHADRGLYVLCWPFDGCGNYEVRACGRTILETLENYNGSLLDSSPETLCHFEENNCYSSVYIFPTTQALFTKVQATEYSCDQFYCHVKRGVALPNHKKIQNDSPFFKELRRFLREACCEKLDSLSTQLCVSSDIELARCLKTNVRNIRNIRQSGSLCALTKLCEKIGIGA